MSLCGQFGWTPQIFWDSTAREFFAFLEGHYEQSRFVQRQEWERARWTTWHLLNIQLDKNSKIDLKDVGEFPWEKDERGPIEVPTQEDIERIRRIYDPIVKKRMQMEGKK